MNQTTQVSFQPLYRIARFSSLAMLILIFLQILVYLIAPPPETVEGFFALYRQNPFLGLLSLDFLYLLNNLILVVLYSALFVLLFRERPVTVLLAFLFGLIGVACYYPSNPAFEMLTLSGGFFQAQSEQQPIYLAAGEALLAGYTGTSFNAYYVLSTLGLLLYAAALLKSPRAKKSLGIWAFTSGLFMIIPSSAGTLGMVFSFLSLIPWVIFIALLMLRFKQLAAVAEPDSIIIENAASSS